MKKPPPFNEIYFSESSQLKSKTSQRSQRSQRTFLENFDIQKESLKLYSFPKGLRTDPLASRKSESQTSIKLDRTPFDDRKMNVYKDQSSPLLTPVMTRGSFRDVSSPLKPRLYSPALGFIDPGTRRKGASSNSLSLCLQRERTDFTSKGNNRFLERVHAINRIEKVLTGPFEFSEPGKRPKSKRNEKGRDFGFITQRSEEGIDLDEPVSLSPEGETRVFLRKYNFAYFSVAIKNQESPLKVTFTVEEGEKAVKFKVYASTKNRSPNKFNSDFEIEGRSFTYSDPEKRPLFGESLLFLAAYPSEDTAVVLRVGFGIERSRIKEIQGLMGAFKEKKRKKRESCFAFSEIPREMLKAQIAEILLRRNSKKLRLSNGVNLIEENKKIALPEAQRSRQVSKRVRVEAKFRETQERHVQTFLAKMEKKTFEIQRHDRVQFMKSYEAYLRRNTELFLRFRDFWKTAVIFLNLAGFLLARAKANRKRRIKEAYMRQLRVATVMAGLRRIRSCGENPVMRVITESRMFLVYRAGFRRGRAKQRAERICSEVLYQAYWEAFMLYLNLKFEKFEKNLAKIQKKWKLLKTRKLMYKATIRNIWNKNFANLIFILKKERQATGESLFAGLNENLLFNNMLLGNIRNRRVPDPSNSTLDTELQSVIIDQFMKENLRKYREKMDKYRQSLNMLSLDAQKKKQVDIVKRFMMKDAFSKRSGKVQIEDRFEEFSRESEEERGLISPPVLYVRPRIEDIKEMMKVYMEVKKML